MKIKIFEGPITGAEEDKLSTLETNKIGDKEAEILEAMENLRLVCKKYDISCLIRILMNEKNFYGAQTAPTETTKAQKDYHFLVSNISEWIERTTNGQLKVVRTEK